MNFVCDAATADELATAMNDTFMTNTNTADNKIMSNSSSNVSNVSTNVLSIFAKTVVKVNQNNLIIIIKILRLGEILMPYVGRLKMQYYSDNDDPALKEMICSAVTISANKALAGDMFIMWTTIEGSTVLENAFDEVTHLFVPDDGVHGDVLAVEAMYLSDELSHPMALPILMAHTGFPTTELTPTPASKGTLEPTSRRFQLIVYNGHGIRFY
mmetsp:Transcript_57651/g.68806  ORF Transcript_57651/g.68806 Transcript_57651/m.68806 type:complete len:213 (-) Transcript_57651:31-669(-)